MYAVLVVALLAPCSVNPGSHHCTLVQQEKAPFTGELLTSEHYEQTRRVMKKAAVSIKALKKQRDRARGRLDTYNKNCEKAIDHLAETATQTILKVEGERDRWRRQAVKEAERVPFWKGLGVLGVGAGAMLPLELCDGFCHDYRWYASGALLTAGIALVIGLSL